MLVRDTLSLVLTMLALGVSKDSSAPYVSFTLVQD